MTAAEGDLFRLLINTVSGIGPKITLNILSGISVTAFRGAVANGVVVPHRVSWVGRLAAALIYGLIRVVAATLRWRFPNDSGRFNGESPQPVIFATWHSRLALAGEIYRCYVKRRHPRRRMAALASASRDGSVVARVLELFGAQPVRGSSSRRGPKPCRN